MSSKSTGLPVSLQSEQPKHNDEESKSIRKNKLKKEKLCRRQEAALATATSSLSLNYEEDPLATKYGDVPPLELQSKTGANISYRTKVEALDKSLESKWVLIRGRVQTIRIVGKKMAFIVIRKNGFTAQCVVQVQPDQVSPHMVKYVMSLSRESIVDIEGIVSVPRSPIKGPSQQAGEQLVRVNQDTRLNYRIIDIRTPANQGIFRIQSQVVNLFRQFLLSEGFFEIQTPKLTTGSSEGGAAVFTLDYMGQPARLAQSPQLYKQMSICGDFDRVFLTGPVFRAENSFTHRHLCEFTHLDVEMEIEMHYFEVMDIVDRLFVAIFDSLNKNCRKDLEAVGRQHPFEPLKYLRQPMRLTFEEGVQMLKDAGVEIDPLGDLNTESERKLGQLVYEKYGTEFYILHRYPLAVRPFYTMPCHDNPAYSNSFDVFIRGEEIASGAQRV